MSSSERPTQPTWRDRNGLPILSVAKRRATNSIACERMDPAFPLLFVLPQISTQSVLGDKRITRCAGRRHKRNQSGRFRRIATCGNRSRHGNSVAIGDRDWHGACEHAAISTTSEPGSPSRRFICCCLIRRCGLGASRMRYPVRYWFGRSFFTGGRIIAGVMIGLAFGTIYYPMFCCRYG